MSWHFGGAVPKDMDYRSPALIEGLLPKAGQGVLLLGTSRIGKTTLLTRIHDDKSRKSSPPIDVRSSPESVFNLLKDPAELVLLDETQRFLSWSDADLRKLRDLIGGRPFIMAAWPTILASQQGEELRQLLDNLRHEWLRPLREDEAARMIRRALGAAPTECSTEAVAAIYQATGGHPNLIAGFCKILSPDGESLPSPTSAELDDFPHSTTGAAAFQDIYNSLPRRMQEVLDECARGNRTRLGCLKEQGLVSGNPAVFRGSFFESFWKEKGVWADISAAGGKEKERSPASGPRPALTWLHISDLHFGAGDPGHRFNQEAITQAILKDVAKRPWNPDFIFVTGDIAFSADPKQYKMAGDWLKQLAKAAGVGHEALRLVPGNHDVDRKLAKKDADTLNAIRSMDRDNKKAPPARLDERLHDADKQKKLREKLKEYVKFVNELVSNHPKTDAAPLDWVEQIPSGPQRPGKIWLAGMCSVWVSDEEDAERKLVVGERQLGLLKDVQEEDLVLLLTHHPPGWLHPTAEDLLLARLAEKSHHIHLCGHVHAAAARALRGLGMPKDSMRLVAGAGHGESSEEHGYAWGALRWNRGSWEVGWSPRIFQRGRGVRPDLNRYDLDDQHFAWEPLSRLKWPAPT